MFAAMGIIDPMCDQCSTKLRRFPVPVVHFPSGDFAISLIKPDGGLDRERSFKMEGGLAMCPKCFDATMDELDERGEEVVTDYQCGCRTQKVGKHFFIKPCSMTCIVYKTVIEKSKQRGNEIEFRRD